MKYSAQEFGLKIELDAGIAQDYVESIRNAFDQSGNDMPKQLNDVICSLETQIEADDEDGITREGNKVIFADTSFGEVHASPVMLDDEGELVDGVEFRYPDGDLIVDVGGITTDELHKGNIEGYLAYAS